MVNKLKLFPQGFEMTARKFVSGLTNLEHFVIKALEYGCAFHAELIPALGEFFLGLFVLGNELGNDGDGRNHAHDGEHFRECKTNAGYLCYEGLKVPGDV